MPAFLCPKCSESRDGANIGADKLQERGLVISRFDFAKKRWERVELETEEFREGTYRVERKVTSQ
jgi:hypothetical protein